MLNMGPAAVRGPQNDPARLWQIVVGQPVHLFPPGWCFGSVGRAGDAPGERARETLLQPGNGTLKSQEAKWGEKPSPPESLDSGRFYRAGANLVSPSFVDHFFEMPPLIP